MPKKNGTEGTSISFRSDILVALDDYCERKTTNRSVVVNQAVKLFLRLNDDEDEAWKDFKRRRDIKS